MGAVVRGIRASACLVGNVCGFMRYRRVSVFESAKDQRVVGLGTHHHLPCDKVKLQSSSPDAVAEDSHGKFGCDLAVIWL